MTEIEREIYKETESIKLIKNTKGYQWEIKLLGTDLKKLKEINAELEREYGGLI